jgi:hypothetical protein
MRICFKIDGVEHCYYIPIIVLPITIPRDGIPQNYPPFLVDATVIASIHEAVRHVSDEGVRGALQHGVQQAIGVLQKRAGAHVQIQLEKQSVG